MKKALIITTISGFVPQFEMNQVFLLQKLGYEVHYATNFDHPVYDYDRELFRKNGIVTHPLSIEKSPARIRRNFQAFLQLKRLLEGERFDLIHCHNPMGGVLGRLAGSLYSSGAVILYTAHGFHFYKGAPIKNWLLYYPAESVLARLTDFLITINEEDYLRGKRFPLRPNGSVWKIPGAGLDVRRFVPRPDARAARKAALGFPADSFLLLSAGELNRNKNHETVIRALSLLPEKNVCYGICGRGDGRGRLEELIEREGLSERVRLLGYRKDIEDVLPAADCFLFPSKREGFGMAAVEAMEGATLISIHQNTYTSSQYHGAQVFYAPTEGSQALAEGFQTALQKRLQPDNERVAKQIPDSVYLMNHITCPAILVECGFLTNPQEEAMLLDQGYQRQMAAVLAGAWLTEQRSGEADLQQSENLLQ